MTTNDEQAGYGEPKREPMLSDKQLGSGLKGKRAYWVKTGPWVRDFYENLITTGKLRVVEEVDAMCGDHGGIEGCSCSKCSAPVAPEYWMYCPGCGNKVKQ